MSGLDLSKRLPCGVDEQLRYDITSFLLVRRLHLSIQDQNPSLADIITPTKLTSNGTKLDLNNADLLGCTIIQGMLSIHPQERSDPYFPVFIALKRWCLITSISRGANISNNFSRTGFDSSRLGRGHILCSSPGNAYYPITWSLLSVLGSGNRAERPRYTISYYSLNSIKEQTSGPNSTFRWQYSFSGSSPTAVQRPAKSSSS